MPLKASNMSLNVASATVEEGDDTVNIVFYPNKISTKLIHQFDKDIDELDQALCKALKSWDVLEDDGSMYPITPEGLAELSFPFKVKVVRAIIGVVRPNSETA